MFTDNTCGIIRKLISQFFSWKANDFSISRYKLTYSNAKKIHNKPVANWPKFHISQSLVLICHHGDMAGSLGDRGVERGPGTEPW